MPVFIHLAFLPYTLNGPNYFLSKLKNIKNQIFHPRLDCRVLPLFYNMQSMQYISRVWPRLKVREKGVQYMTVHDIKAFSYASCRIKKE
jgi:hypothetical protein